ncbi:hypothetical protein DM02DRAFT_613561 [Periconia macrospinosa]|uniref:Secreted protein n=1 Tax=Periconia macrospinosa TaxID=97972 RepID=A0A2V1DTN5_9PLEO|nr:hypothetical protein DM02DRAFT_613561 [Periconia macrospinosa]
MKCYTLFFFFFLFPFFFFFHLSAREDLNTDQYFLSSLIPKCQFYLSLHLHLPISPSLPIPLFSLPFPNKELQI